MTDMWDSIKFMWWGNPAWFILMCLIGVLPILLFVIWMIRVCDRHK